MAAAGKGATALDDERHVKRNPHPDFKKVEASRPNWRDDVGPRFTKTRNPDWKLGDGPNDGGACLEKKHVQIDPYEDGRPVVFNYKLLISAIIPRPVGFISTRSKDGQITNVSPFSFFQMIGHDPPLFIFGFASGLANAKDSLKNLMESGECVINIISEHYIEAANAASINAPYGVSEFGLTGLHMADSVIVKAPRVQEAIFSVEGKLVETREFYSKAVPGKATTVLAIVEGVRFWAREDAINEDRNLLDPNVLRPMARLGGISYGRLTECIELPRPDYDTLVGQKNINTESSGSASK
ncbi:hypothetical protein VTN00DRAFT_9112 [Thermoascus crustaceus]|uniref:uncharacterized protein n=1 Tax=Thermoascus crustaceus TaxID=5088 RepID=UPI003743F0FA